MPGHNFEPKKNFTVMQKKRYVVSIIDSLNEAGSNGLGVIVTIQNHQFSTTTLLADEIVDKGWYISVAKPKPFVDVLRCSQP